MSMRSPLGRARGFGSAKEGVHHWWVQRATALALIPLALWFVIGVVGLAGADYATTRAWIAQPLPAVALLLLLLAAFHHGQLGLQVVIEDYIHHEGRRIALILLVKALAAVACAAAAFAVLRIALGG